MSWSTKIIILYLGFVAIILTLVVICFGHKTELEFKDYYAREINFQQQIDAANNQLALATPIEHQVEGRTVRFSIPQELLSSDLKGTVLFLRPADASQDKEINLTPDKDGNFLIEHAGFSQGIYKMQIRINSHGKNYFKESVIKFK